MKKISLKKMSEQIGRTYDNSGNSKEQITNVQYRIVDAETDAEVGRANVNLHDFSISVSGVADGIEENVALLETMFNERVEA